MRKVATIALLAAFALNDAANACAVCWGGASDSSMIDGAKMSILFMAILIYSVLGGFIAGVVVIGRRARAVAALTPETSHNEMEQ